VFEKKALKRISESWFIWHWMIQKNSINPETYLSVFHLRQHPAPNPRVQTATVAKEKLPKRYLTYANIYTSLVYISSNWSRKREAENRTGNQATY
jgi:hypothetical protein